MIEKNIERIANAIEAIQKILTEYKSVPPSAPVVEVKPEPEPEPVVEVVQPEPVVEVEPEPAPVFEPEPAPVFEPEPEPTPVVEAGFNPAPFNDQQGLVKYITIKYKSLDQEKKEKMVAVLRDMGHANMNSITPSEYDEFYSRVEAL
jgi:hypothetical protein